jgi:hypothetical protein
VAEKKPSVGQTVHWVSKEQTPNGEQPPCYAAVIAAVDGHEVRLSVFGPNGPGAWMPSIRDDTRATVGTWHWPERA